MVLLPPAYYWLGMGDYLQSRFSESARNLKTALRLAEAGNNTFEIQHAEHALALNYSEIGELEPALFYAGKLLSDKELYFKTRANTAQQGNARISFSQAEILLHLPELVPGATRAWLRNTGPQQQSR